MSQNEFPCPSPEGDWMAVYLMWKILSHLKDRLQAGETFTAAQDTYAAIEECGTESRRRDAVDALKKAKAITVSGQSSRRQAVRYAITDVGVSLLEAYRNSLINWEKK